MKKAKNKVIRKFISRAIFITFFFALSFTPSQAAFDNKGTEFWLAIPTTAGGWFQDGIFHIMSDVNTSGTVTVPGIGFSSAFSVTAGNDTPVTMPLAANLGLVSDVVQDKGIHITAMDEVSVVFSAFTPGTHDAYLGLPIDVMGTEYIIPSYPHSPLLGENSDFGTELVVVASEDDTRVCITLPIDVGTRNANVPYFVTLDQGQTYQIYSYLNLADLSGATIISTKPVAVYGGNLCTNVPTGVAACDYLIEQLTPTSLWGTNFVTMPHMSRENGDIFRYFAKEDTTTVTVNGTVVALLNRGEFYEERLTISGHISSDKPIQVIQWATGTMDDNRWGEPAMMLVQPTNQFASYYLTSTVMDDPQYRHYIDILVPDTAVGAVTLDGSLIPVVSYTAIGASGYSGYQSLIAAGPHTVVGPEPVGVRSYGFKTIFQDGSGGSDSYSFPSGMAFSSAPVTTPPTLVAVPSTETLPVGNSGCVTVTWNDINGDPVVGEDVIFNVTGANAQSATILTDASGKAVFCYTGSNPGWDTIEALGCPVMDTVTKNWLLPPAICYQYMFQWGSPGSGNGQFNTDSGIAIDGTFVYVTEYNNDRVQKFDLNGIYVDQWGSSGSGDGQFNGPEGIDVNGGFVYVVDRLNHRIQKFNLAGNFVTKWGSFGAGVGQFNGPNGVSVSGGYVYVTDTFNDRIQKFTLDGTFVAQWTLLRGEGIRVVNGEIFASETLMNRVKKFDLDGTLLLTWGSGGSGDGQFDGSQGITTDGTNIFVSEASGDRVQIFDTNGTFLGKFGSGGSGDGQFNLPLRLYYDAGLIYVVDSFNHRVQVFEPCPGSPTPTLTQTPTSTHTKTQSKTWTPTSTYTVSPTITPTWTPTWTLSWTPTYTPTHTATHTPTFTPTWTSTSTPTWTGTITLTTTDTSTITSTSTLTYTPTHTPTITVTPTWTMTPSPTPTGTPSWTPTSSVTPTATPTPFTTLILDIFDASGEKVHSVTLHQPGLDSSLPDALEIVWVFDETTKAMIPLLSDGQDLWNGVLSDESMIQPGLYHVVVRSSNPEEGSEELARFTVSVVLVKSRELVEIVDSTGKVIQTLEILPSGGGELSLTNDVLVLARVGASVGIQAGGISLKDLSGTALVWDGKNGNGETVPPGIYTIRYVRVLPDGTEVVREITLVVQANLFESGEKVILVPNPVLGQEKVSVYLNIIAGLSGKVKLYTIDGVLVHSVTFDPILGLAELDIRGLAAGFYLVVIKVEGADLQRPQVVIKRLAILR